MLDKRYKLFHLENRGGGAFVSGQELQRLWSHLDNGDMQNTQPMLLQKCTIP